MGAANRAALVSRYLRDLQDAIRRASNTRAAKGCFEAYLDLQAARGSDSRDALLDQFVRDAEVVLLSRLLSTSAVARAAPHLFYYENCFGWLEELVCQFPLGERREWLQGQSACEDDPSRALLEAYVPLRDRKRLGQHYTPADIVDYIIARTVPVDNFGDTLDPAVGSGAFALGWLRHYVRSGYPCGGSFVGYDVNLASLAVAGLNLEGFYERNRLSTRPSIHLEARDALVAFETVETCGDLFGDFEGYPRFQQVVGNPPYVRIQQIQPASLRDRYRRCYPRTATGRFDLYMLFIEAACRALTRGGRLGFVVSNKLLTSNAASGARRFISENLRVRKIVDLGDAKLFQAAVLPLIIIGENQGGAWGTFGYASVREARSAKGLGSACSAPVMDCISEVGAGGVSEHMVVADTVRQRTLEIEAFTTSFPVTQPGGPWHFTNQTEAAVLDVIRSAGTPLEGLCSTISAGVKSTADDVFCNPITKTLVEQREFEPEFVKPYLRGGNIQKWAISWSGERENEDTYLIYPHRQKDGRTASVDLSEIPHIAAWLEEHRTQLSARIYVRQAGRRWYEIWVPQKPANFRADFKILTPDFSTHNAFAIDREKRWCGGSAFMIVPAQQEEEWCLCLLGLLNSHVLEFFHKKACSTFIYANRYRYTATPLRRYPIPPLTDIQQYRIASLVSKLVADPTSMRLEERLNDEVRVAFGLDDDQYEVIRNEVCWPGTPTRRNLPNDANASIREEVGGQRDLKLGVDPKAFKLGEVFKEVLPGTE